MRLLERPGTLELVHRLSSYITTSGYRFQPREPLHWQIGVIAAGYLIVIGLSEDDVAHESEHSIEQAKCFSA